MAGPDDEDIFDDEIDDEFANPKNDPSSPEHINGDLYWRTDAEIEQDEEDD